MGLFLLKLQFDLEYKFKTEYDIKIDFSNPPQETCIIWKGSLDRYGYARMTWKSKAYRVHRLTYMVFHQVCEIDTDKEVSHLCHTKDCVNPRHLVLENHHINMSRQECLLAKNCLKSHTPNCIF